MELLGFFSPCECNESKCNLDSKHWNKYNFERQEHFFSDYLSSQTLGLCFYNTPYQVELQAYRAIFFTSSVTEDRRC